MSPRRGTALQWARLAMAGSVLTALCAFLALVHVPLLPAHGSGFWNEVWAYRLRVMVYLTPFALGLTVMIWAERRFRRGYQNDLWTETELAQVRSLTERRIWAGVALGILLLWVLAIFWQHSLRGGGLWYALAMPSQTAQRIIRLITPKPAQSAGLIAWHNLQPIRSDHWGESGLRS